MENPKNPKIDEIEKDIIEENEDIGIETAEDEEKPISEASEGNKEASEAYEEVADDDDDDYDDDDDDDDDDEDEEDEDELIYDGVVYDVKCPVCGEEITVDEETLAEGSINCPVCGELLEFDLSEEE